jgi:uncharacterized protein (TIGR03086 family)
VRHAGLGGLARPPHASSVMDALTAYEQTLVWTGQRIAGVRHEDLALATPCTEWSVRALIAHVVAGIWYFQALATGEPVEQLMRGLTDLVGDDPFASYDRAARAGLEAWRAPGRLERSYTMPLGERPGRDALGIHQADLLIHGWDLAEATHQDSTMSDELARFALETEQALIHETGGRRRAYAEALPVPSGATDQDRLLAFVGRSATWR